jgi:hypothetical protein
VFREPGRCTAARVLLHVSQIMLKTIYVFSTIMGHPWQVGHGKCS